MDTNAEAFSAVVLTHDRPNLATRTVEYLLDVEGIPPHEVLVIINGVGGLREDFKVPVQTVRLDQNYGPAGGFASAFEEAERRLTGEWVYVCEDDVCLLDFQSARLVRLREALAASRYVPESVGAIVAYGRKLDRRTGRTVPDRPSPRDPELIPTDVAAWGATLLPRHVLRAHSPVPELFFGYEDFDFFLRLHAAGLHVLLDRESGLATAEATTDHGRAAAFSGVRPHDSEEPWRHYYAARNFVFLAREHGRLTWHLDHLVRSVRRWHLAGHEPHTARAILRGLRDGYAGNLGMNPSFFRERGEVSG